MYRESYTSINQSFEKAHKEHEYTANRNSMHTRKQISTHTVSRAARQQKQIILLRVALR